MHIQELGIIRKKTYWTFSRDFLTCHFETEIPHFYRLYTETPFQLFHFSTNVSTFSFMTSTLWMILLIALRILCNFFGILMSCRVSFVERCHLIASFCYFSTLSSDFKLFSCFDQFPYSKPSFPSCLTTLAQCTDCHLAECTSSFIHSKLNTFWLSFQNKLKLTISIESLRFVMISIGTQFAPIEYCNETHYKNILFIEIEKGKKVSWYKWSRKKRLKKWMAKDLWANLTGVDRFFIQCPKNLILGIEMGKGNRTP